MLKSIIASIILSTATMTLAQTAPWADPSRCYRGVELRVVHGGSAELTDVQATIQGSLVQSATVVGASWQGDDTSIDKALQVQAHLDTLRKEALCVERTAEGIVIYRWRNQRPVSAEIQDIVSK